MTTVRFKLLHERAKVATYATDGSCGADLYAADTYIIPPGAAWTVDTGVAVEIPRGHVGLVLPRSGMARRQNPAEVGVIDDDFRGGMGVTLTNHSCERLDVRPGDRIAQLLIVPCVRAEFVEAEELSETARAGSGFGSTGVR